MSKRGKRIHKIEFWNTHWEYSVKFMVRIFVLFNIFWKNFNGSFRGRFFGFILPWFLIIVIFILFKDEVIQSGSRADEKYLIEGLILLPCLSLGVVSLPQTLVIWKNSIFLKRVEVSPVSKKNFFFGLIFFYTFICWLAMMWLIMWAWVIMAISNNISYANDIFNNISAGWLIVVFLLAPPLAISLGIIIAARLTNSSTAQALGFLTFFPFAFLSGIILPAYLLDNSSEIFKNITYILPTKPIVFIMNIAWNNGLLPGHDTNLFKFTEYSAVWQPPVITTAWIIGFVTLSSFTFKMSVN